MKVIIEEFIPLVHSIVEWDSPVILHYKTNIGSDAVCQLTRAVQVYYMAPHPQPSSVVRAPVSQSQGCGFKPRCRCLIVRWASLTFCQGFCWIYAASRSTECSRNCVWGLNGELCNSVQQKATSRLVTVMGATCIAWYIYLLIHTCVDLYIEALVSGNASNRISRN